jgi:hypothetical protein
MRIDLAGWRRFGLAVGALTVALVLARPEA